MARYVENVTKLAKDLEAGKIDGYTANTNDDTITVFREDGIETIKNDDEWRPAP